MELGVLELGLKNQQFSNVRCFLKIQTEAFRLKTLELLRDAHKDSVVKFSCLLDQWQEIFAKITSVLRTTTSTNSTYTHSSSSGATPRKLATDFGSKLCRIALQTSNELLSILTNASHDSEHFNQVKNSFLRKLGERVQEIRNILHVEHGNNKKTSLSAIAPARHDQDDKSGTKKRQTSPIDYSEWEYLDSEEIVRISLSSNKLLLAQTWLAKTRGANEAKWQKLCRQVFTAIFAELNEHNIQEACFALSSLGISAIKVLKVIFRNTFDDNLRTGAAKELSSREQLNDTDITCLNLLEAIFLTYPNRTFIFNIKAVSLLKDEADTSILLPRCFMEKKLSDSCKNYVKPDCAWSTLIFNGEEGLLIDWIEAVTNHGTDEDNEFPFKLPLTQEMLDQCLKATYAARESLLNCLATKGILQNAELTPNATLGRLFRLSMNGTSGLTGVFTREENHPLRKNSSVMRFDDFLTRLWQYAASNDLTDFMMWFSTVCEKDLLSASDVNPKLKELLLFYASNHNSDFCDPLAVNLQLARYVFDVNSESRALIELGKNDKNVRQLLLYMLQFLSLEQICDISYEDKNGSNLQELFSSEFPLIQQELLKTQNMPVKKMNTPTIYDLLDGSTCFDVAKLFLWQNANRRRVIDSSSIIDLPHFSHPKLAGLHGLKANLNFLYYVGEGRPIEAFLRRISKSSSMSSKRLESACMKASVVGFFHCSEPEVAASSVIFQELLRSDSAGLRLHLALANLVLLHAANYLALSPRAQVTTLGSLLKKATYLKDKQAPNRLLQLLVTALGKKYEYGNECTVEECMEWQVAIRFSQEYNLEMPTEFLIKCAQTDDWLLFIIFAQMYDYSKDVIIPLLQSFNNGCISDHLDKAFQSTTYNNDKDNSPVSIIKGKGKKNVSGTHYRNTLYSRIGVRQTPSSSSEPGSLAAEQRRLFPGSQASPPLHAEVDEMRSIASETDITNMETLSVISRTSADSSDYVLEMSSPPKDFFSLLVLCQKVNVADPWKAMMTASVIFNNHIFALLASSLAPKNSPNIEFDCFCCWLYSSFDIISKLVLSNEPYYQSWTEEDFSCLLRNALVIPKNFVDFHLGLKLFDYKNSPLASLVQFFVEYLVEKEYYKSVQSLKTFQEQLWALSKHEDKQKSGLLMDSKAFVEHAAVTILMSGLKATANSYELRILLRHLDFARVQNSFSSEISVPDFRKLYRMCQCLSETDIEISVLEFMNISEDNLYYTEFAKRVVYSLQERRYFAEALQFTNIIGLESNVVILNEWQIKAVASGDNVSFWKGCLETIEKTNIPNAAVVKFIQSSIDRSCSIFVRAFLLTKKCGLLVRENNHDKEELFESEIALWTDILSLESENHKSADYDEVWAMVTQLEMSSESSSGTELTSQMKHLNTCVLSPDQVPMLDSVVGKLIVNGNISTAYRVAELFNYYSHELEIVDVCSSLANRKTPKDAGVELAERIFAKELSIKTLFRGRVENLETEEIALLLEKMTNAATYSQIACKRIFLLFKISCELEKSYGDLLLEKDSILIIKYLISPSVMSTETVALAKELITMNSIGDEKLAELLSNLLIEELMDNCYEAALVDGSLSSETGSAFLMLLRLLNNTSELGRRLLDVVKEQSEDYPQRVVVELYIRAHDCFTTSSDIEGIAVVLRNAKCLVVQHLAVSSDYQSMIRLLTGIGRYSEMTYMFDILRENHEFEVLLGKGITKNPQLRIALLDSLKGDQDMYPLVALNFSMHREIAEMLENDALRFSKNVQFRPNQNAIIFREMLERSLNALVDASESYSKAACYNQAARCAKKAELMALQIYFLPTGQQVVNLPEASVTDFVARHPNCSEAAIVAEAYNNQTTWGSALYHNVVERGDWSYFREFQLQMQLTSVLLEEVVKKYMQTRSKKLLSESGLNAATLALQKLLNYSDDGKFQMRMYRQLGFAEQSNRLLLDENNAFLRDMQSSYL